MNLEELNLVELNAQEVVAVDGGLWAELAVAACFLVPGYGVGIVALGIYNGYHSNN